MKGPYDDIIDLPHYVSQKRPQMSMPDRAAQFSPFAALTGYDAAIQETGRLTDERIELEEEALNILNRKYQMLMDTLSDNPEVTITYFVPDERKEGGSYVTKTGFVKKLVEFERLIILRDGTKIPMSQIIDISGLNWGHPEGRR